LQEDVRQQNLRPEHIGPLTDGFGQNRFGLPELNSN
jgi:hypothetical protein